MLFHWYYCGQKVQKLEQSSNTEIELHGKNVEKISHFGYLGATLDEHQNKQSHSFYAFIILHCTCYLIKNRLMLVHNLQPVLIIRIQNELSCQLSEEKDSTCD